MALKHKVIILSDSENTLLSDDENNDYYHVDITVQNIDDEALVYLGAEGLNPSSYGMILYPGSTMSISRISESDAIYAFSDINESKLAVFISSSVKKASYP